MNKITLPKFDPLEGQEAPDTIISITEPLSRPDTLGETATYYDEQAEILVDALINSLPQGMLEPLMVKLMQRRVSLYCGRMEKP